MIDWFFHGEHTFEVYHRGWSFSSLRVNGDVWISYVGNKYCGWGFFTLSEKLVLRLHFFMGGKCWIFQDLERFLTPFVEEKYSKLVFSCAKYYIVRDRCNVSFGMYDGKAKLNWSQYYEKYNRIDLDIQDSLALCTPNGEIDMRGKSPLSKNTWNYNGRTYTKTDEIVLVRPVRWKCNVLGKKTCMYLIVLYLFLWTFVKIRNC